MIKLDLTRTLMGKGDKASLKTLEKKYGSRMHDINAMIELKSGLGSDYLGWISYPNENQKPLIDEIKIFTNEITINKQIDTLVIIGAGGTVVASKALIEGINGLFPGKKQPIDIIYAGESLSSTYIKQLLEELNNRNYIINIVAKDSATLETDVAFSLIKKHLEKKYGLEESSSRIIITTGFKSELRDMATKNHYRIFTIPDDIMGRYSVATPVTLLPMSFAGIDINQFIEGAKLAILDTKSGTLNENSAMIYACYRHWNYEVKKKQTEVFGVFEKQLSSLTRWQKQLFAESEGKESMGIMPVPATFSSDLHRMGQFLQDGSKIFFETILKITEPSKNLEILAGDMRNDLEFIEGMKLSEINDKVMRGALNAHSHDAGTPVLVIELENMGSKGLGYFSQWLLKTAAVSAYMFKVNPFNNPGVEIYKNKMFRLLGRKD